jgi:nucleotide-binding universal stress UspA family protein
MAFGKQRQAKQPREAHAIGMKKLSIQSIVVPIDFSKMSIQAIKTAGGLARRFAASVHLAHVHHFDYAADFVAPAPPIVPFSFMPYE